MTGRFGRYVRKWLLDTALAIRNRAQTRGLDLESLSESDSANTDSKRARGAADAIQPGGPPAHWVRMVQRHAPGLLDAAHPHNTAGVPSEGSWPVAQEKEWAWIDNVDASGPCGGRDSSEMQVHAILTAPPKALRPVEEYENPDRIQRREEQKISAKKMAAIADGPECPDITRLHPAGNIPVHTFEPGMTGSSMVRRSPVALPQHEKQHQRGLPAGQSEKTAGDQPGHQTKSRRQCASVVRQVGMFSTPGCHEQNNGVACLTEKNVTAAWRREAGSERRSAVRSAQQAPDSKRDPSDVGSFMIRSAQSRAEPASIDRSRTRHNRSLGMPQPPDGADGQLYHAADIRHRRPESVGLRHDDGRGMRTESLTRQKVDAEKKEKERSLFSGLCWPALPGETRLPADAQMSIWPELPAERADHADEISKQMQSHPCEIQVREVERLRQLDDEQKGTSWSESYF